MDTATPPIGADYHNTGLPSLNQRFQKRSHAFVEQAITFDSTPFLINALEFRDRDIAKENGSTFRLLVTSVLADVPNGNVYWPPLLIASKPGKVCLV